jgi:Tfp pilus assembly protein PilV
MPKTYVAQHILVTMHTFFARLLTLGRSSIGRRSLTSERGDTLIEVMVSAVLVALIVVGTFSGLDSTNKATALQRARSQADALAEHAEEQLRSEPIKRLVELTESHPLEETVKENGSTYTIVSTAEYIEDKNATKSCNTSISAKADYLQTTSKVTWKALLNSKGELVGKPVEESGIISPPAGSALIVQVQESGTALPGALVAAKGPSPATTSYELETSANGCAILAVPPGEYNIYASKSGYVDPNGYPNTHEDESGSVTRSVYIPAENTSKVGYNLGLAGTLAVSFTGSTPAEGDSFVAFNTGMTTFRPFPKPFTPGSYSTTVTSPPTIFPFTTKYTVYAGTCEADLPTKNGGSSNPEILVEPGKTAAVSVPLPPVNFVVKSGIKAGTAAEEGHVMEAKGSTTDGCTSKRTLVTSSGTGGPTRPGLPYGKYEICVGGKIGAVEKKWVGTFENNSATGPTSTTWTNGGTGSHVIYLGLEPSGSPPGTGTVSSGTCP